MYLYGAFAAQKRHCADALDHYLVVGAQIRLGQRHGHGSVGAGVLGRCGLGNSGFASLCFIGVDVINAALRQGGKVNGALEAVGELPERDRLICRQGTGSSSSGAA